MGHVQSLAGLPLRFVTHGEVKRSTTLVCSINFDTCTTESQSLQGPIRPLAQSHVRVRGYFSRSMVPG